MAVVQLNNGLISTFNKTLDFHAEMNGSAVIITDDLRLIQRVFNQLRKLVDH